MMILLTVIIMMIISVLCKLPAGSNHFTHVLLAPPLWRLTSDLVHFPDEGGDCRLDA